VRYAEEQISVRDFVKFRTELDVQRGYLGTEFFLKCELYYAPLPSHNFQLAISSPEIMKQEVEKLAGSFKCVQTRVFQLNNLLLGLSTVVPISFDREYSSICQCTLHGSLIDFKFRVKNYRADGKAGGILIHRDGDTFMENGILVELKYVEISPDDSPETGKRKKLNR
jgi:hypothetical protein